MDRRPNLVSFFATGHSPNTTLQESIQGDVMDSGMAALRIDMSLFFCHKRTPEEWYRCLTRSKEPLDLAKPLLSGQPFIDKVKIVLAMPGSACKNKGGMRELEFMLEEGRVHSTRADCTLPSFLESRRRSRKMSTVVGSLDYQRDIYVEDEVGALQKSMAKINGNRAIPPAQHVSGGTLELG